MIEKVISGGQTGADQAGWRAARRFGVATGGWMPRGFRTEEGPRPEFATLYGAAEIKAATYPPRTRMNVFGSDATIIFDTSPGKSLEEMSRGTQLVIEYAMKYGKPNVTARVELGRPIEPRRPARMAKWIVEQGIVILNVAGNRESSSPGIGMWAEDYLCQVFAILGFQEIA